MVTWLNAYKALFWNRSGNYVRFAQWKIIIYVKSEMARNYQLTMEDYYICKLKTIELDGLNVRHGTFAKFYYNQF